MDPKIAGVALARWTGLGPYAIAVVDDSPNMLVRSAPRARNSSAGLILSVGGDVRNMAVTSSDGLALACSRTMPLRLVDITKRAQ